MDPIKSDLKTKIIGQLEYYFSDYNLMRDKFLKELIIRDNGWISFDALMKFNRLNQLLDNKKDVLKSIDSDSDLIEINGEEERVRRKPDKPMPVVTEELIRAVNERTVHVKGFSKDTTVDEVKEWSLKYGSIDSIEMRYNMRDKEFKGCAFIAFKDKSMADRLLNQSVLKFKNEKLLKENKLRYYERKTQFIEELRKQRADKRAVRLANELEKKLNTIEVKRPDNSSVLKVLKLPKRVPAKAVKEFFDKYFDKSDSKVLYVNKIFKKGFGFVRFDGQMTAEEVLDKIVSNDEKSDQSVGKVVIEGKEMTVRMLTDEESNRFWKSDIQRSKYLKINDFNRNKWWKKRETNVKNLDQKYFQKRIDRRVNKLKENPILFESAVLNIDLKMRYPLADLKKYFKTYATIVDVQRKDYSFDVRFGNICEAKNVLAVVRSDLETGDPMRGLLVIEGHNCSTYVLTGEEEKEFWLKSIDRIEKKAIERQEQKNQKRRIRKKMRTEEPTEEKQTKEEQTEEEQIEEEQIEEEQTEESSSSSDSSDSDSGA